MPEERDLPSVDERWMLLAQVAIALDDLDMTDKVLGAAGAELPRALIAALRSQLDDQRRDLQSLRQSLRDESPKALSSGWLRLDQTLPRSQQVFRETLEVLGGALLRRDGYDGGICGIADALVNEILGCVNRSIGHQVHWDGMTMLDVGESYSHLGGTIRLRFPELNVWALPIVAHEVGHLLVTEASVWDQEYHKPTLPLLALVQTDGPASSPNAHLGELLADVLATLALGSAYACSALLLRFNPAQADKPCRAHPTVKDRVYVIVRTLRMLGTGYIWTADRLQEGWSVAGGVGLEPAAVQRLDSFVDTAVDTIYQNIKDLPYRSLSRAIALQDYLSDASEPVRLAADGAQIADVLTAAWRVRLGAAVVGRSLDLRAVSKRVTALCDTILGGGDV